MNETSEIIFLIMCIGIAYNIGKSLGIRSTIDYLEQEGILHFDDTEK